MKEKRLVLQAKAGNQKALEELVRMYYQAIYKYFVRKTSSTHTALDLTQDTFFKLVTHLKEYVPYKDFEAYLYTIAYHVAMDYYKKKKDMLLHDDTMFEFQQAPHEEKSENYYQMQKVLQRLPQKQRDCIILYYYQELTYRQIAEVLHIPESTAKTRVRAGLEKCKQLWEECK